MESADESVDGSQYSRMHVASICGSPSISGTVTSNNGNPFCLFYSPTLAIQHNNVIQSSRASNSWIASLRSNKHSRSPIMSGRQHELSERDNGGWIDDCGTGPFYGRSPSIDGRLPTSSPHSLRLPSSSSFRQWGSLESIQRNQRLRQLAAQSKSKVRSLSARESTAAAERWRYIQTVLERRRKESLERRERFIRQPLDHILRQKATTLSGGKRVEPPAWDSFVAGRSILKRRALNWRTKAGRHVHFEANQPNRADDNCCPEGEEEEMAREKLPQLPIVSIPEETEAPSNDSSFSNEEDQRLPLLLMTPSPRLEIITDVQHDPVDDTTQRVSPSGPSWVERQVAKVRQRKLWAFRQQQQQQQQQQKLNNHPPPRTILKRSVSLLVNVPDEQETDSLNEEEDDEGDQSDSGQSVVDDGHNGRLGNNKRQSLAWEVLLDKDEFVEMPSDQIKDAEATDDPHGGWPHFPVKLAICIQQRQKSLKERTKAGRKEETTTAAVARSEGKFHPNNSFARRKRFGKRLSIAVVRQRKRRMPKRGPLSSAHQPQASRQLSGESQQPTKNADKGHDPAVPANPIPDDVGQCSTSAIPLQVLDADAESVPEISWTHKSNEIESTYVASSSLISSPSDLISEADVMTQQAALLLLGDSSSASPESEAETIAADAQYHLEEMIPAADDSMAKGTDDEDYDQTAGSAFSPASRSGQRRREEITDADETISDVTVDDGPYLIDQPEPNVMTAIPPQQDVGMASRADNIPAAAAGIRPVEQTEFRIASPLHSSSSSSSGIDNKDSPTGKRRRLPAYCSGWRPMAIPDQNGGDAIVPPMATVSYWNNFEAPTSEETTMAGTINRPEVDVSSDATAFALTVPAAQKDSNHPPEADPTAAVIIQTPLDKKTKEARNASRILLPPAVTSTTTQTEPPSGHGSKEDHRAEEEKFRSDDGDSTGDVKDSHEEETAAECQCLHRAVLTCLLPEAAETLANLELIRRQLKKARIRRQGNEQPSRQPLQVRRDIFSTFDPNIN